MGVSWKQWIVGGLWVFSTFLSAQEHPDLGRFDDCPQVTEVWLGALLGEVAVNPEFPIVLSIPGEFLWKVTDGKVIEKNEVIGISNAKKLELSERDLLVKKNRYQNSRIDIDFANQNNRKTLKNSKRELEKKLAEMVMTDSEKTLLGAAFEKRLKKERAEIESELEKTRSKLESDYFDLALAADRNSLDLELEHAEFDYQELVKSSEVVSSVSGKIVILNREPIRSETVIGNIIKEGLAEVRLEMADLRLRSIPGEELVIEVSGEDGRRFRGVYQSTLDARSLDRNAKILIFEIQKLADREPISPRLSGSRMVRIFRKLAKPGRAIDKDGLLFKFPQEISSMGWASFVEKRWAGVKVTYVGPKVIVVNRLNEN